MARICPLFSGSTANSTYVSGSSGSFLVDAGSSFSSLKKEFAEKGFLFGELKGIFITHTHSDHTKGLSVLLKNVDIPVIASHQTLEYLIEHNLVPEKANLLEIDEKGMELSGAQIKFFSTSHDALGSGGYSFLLPDGNKISVCTDLGVVTESVRNAILGSNLVMLESNHDLKMLKNGPYPPELKMRIMSDRGHLSNISAANELKNLLNGGTNRFILAHLSQHNNTPNLARSAATASLLDLGAKASIDYILNVAAPKGNEVVYL